MSVARSDVGLSWLVTIRWASISAQVAAIVVGELVLGLAVPLASLSLLAGVFVASNAVLTFRMRRGAPLALAAAGALLCADTIALAWILAHTGGPLNPLSIFFLVHIVMAALVLGQAWAWGVTALCAGSYAALFLATSPELAAAQAMHPEFAKHFRGMWWAFAATALLIALFVTRLSRAIAGRDAALAVLRDAAARSERLSSLATLAAGAAHELSTPLGTIVVAAREAERAIERIGTAQPELLDDVRLIGAEARRCREVLDAMAADTGQPAGEMPRAISSTEMIALILEQVPAPDRARVTARGDVDGLTWPVRAVARVVGNLVHNGLDASPAGSQVDLVMSRAAGDGRVSIVVTDRGAGIDSALLARVGEPFFTTKPPGRGLGLGVFIARSTVERLRGTFDIHSVPAQGCVVTLTLPRRIDQTLDHAR
jgi:two-component system sensor histidine kinase RegB